MRPAVFRTTDDAVECFTIDRARNVYSLGRQTIYNAIKAGELRAIKAGTRTLLRRADIEAWLNSLPLLQTA